jgi:ubiquinone/menaquinone biosynthesis C-methylase UbiE
MSGNMIIKTFHNKIIKLIPKTVRHYCWRENYITAHPEITWWENHINYLVLKQYSNSLTGRVADFGCNHGACTILAARNPNISEIIGIDINPQSIKCAHELLESSKESVDTKNKIKFLASNCKKLNFDDDYFDSAYLFHVIEHLLPEDRDLILKEIKRVLKNNGTFLITLPYLHAYDDFHHVEYFDEEKITQIMKKAGFQVLECYRDRRSDEHTPAGHDCLNVFCINEKSNCSYSKMMTTS